MHGAKNNSQVSRVHSLVCECGAIKHILRCVMEDIQTNKAVMITA